MPLLMAPPLPPGCPWSGWTPPNVDWCEQELCAWIVNPADAWSNLAYVAAGLAMWQHARNTPSAAGGLFAPASITVGVFSFAYHASYTYFLQFFDFVGMFLFCFTAITANALRLGWIEPPHRWPFLLAGVGGLSASVPLLSETAVPIQSLVAVLILAILAQEFAIWRRSRAVGAGFRFVADYRIVADYRSFAAALLLLSAAGAASLADVTRTWCDPTNHWLQGHALWHLLTAAALYALYRFYAGLQSPPPPGPRADSHSATTHRPEARG
jgi:hypothetical protein